MPHSSFKDIPITTSYISIKCPCGQMITYNSDRELNNKKRLHSRFCAKILEVPTVILAPPKKRMMTKELKLHCGELIRKNSKAINLVRM